MRGALVALIASLFMLAASPSQAHRISTRDGPPPAGVSIPSLTHGQMAVIRDNLPAIRALASARLGFDLTTWRLEDYLNLQSFACLWGVVPGSITDEDSPFNECAHAYLAAGRALLLQLAREPGADHKSIDALISKIEVEMLADGASLNLCRYSDEPFNTNEVIWPHWGMIPFHPRTAMLAAAAFAAMGAAVWGAWPRRIASSLRSLEGETAVKCFPQGGLASARGSDGRLAGNCLQRQIGGARTKEPDRNHNHAHRGGDENKDAERACAIEHEGDDER